ncbi:MAG: hypothetical protein K0B81_08410 [Candidatus Cloacimonetes bacterium]|nr:hypothetical protein [Candidatus Cloacimonadota bacterium]
MKEEMNELIKYREFSKYLNLIPGFIHNLNTPLMSISGRVELIKFKIPDLQGIDQIMQQLEKINNTINVVKYMIEKDKLESKQKIDLTTFIDIFDQFLNLNLIYKHKIKLEKEIEDGSSIDILPFMMLNVLYEVFDNCINLMEDGGTIRIKIYRDASRVYFEVMRSGQNIPEDLVKDINAKTKAKLDAKELVDLLVVKKMLEDLGGAIKVKNMPNGVEYLFNIPK